MEKLLSWLIRNKRPAVLVSIVAAIGAALVLTLTPTPYRTFDLEAQYGVTWQHDHTLAQHGYTYAQAQQKFPDFVTWLEQQGWSQSEVLGLYEFCCAWNDAFWRGNGYFTEVPVFSDVTRSRLKIIAPHGAFHLNYPCLFNQGIYEGQGAGNYSGTQGQSTGGTGLYLDNTNWMVGRSPERFCLKTITWGLPSGYAECFTVRNFRFEGGRTSMVNDPSFIAAGMGIWDSGEASGVEYCYAFGFNSYGFMNVRGTPSRFDQCSAFSNGIFGFGLIGNDLSTVTIIGPSGDDNGALIGVRGGYERPGGATVTVVGAKSESGKRTPYRKQKLFDGQGAGNWTITGAWAHAVDAPECVIAADFQTHNGQIDVRGLKFEGYTTALRLTAKGSTTTYSAATNSPLSFVAIETGLLTSTRTMTPSGGTTPPPTTCTWVAGTKTCGACVNSTQTCTTPFVSSVAGCTPTASKPADVVTTQACTVTPPTTALYTASNLSNSAVDAKVKINGDVGIANVKRVVFTTIKQTVGGGSSYPYLLGMTGDTGVQSVPGGAIVGWNVTLTATGSLVVGTAVNVTVTFATPQTVLTLYNRAGSRDAFIGSIGKVEFFAQ